jgi:tRNA-modifying protein YgfZ
MAQSEQWTPQMLNLEHLHAFSLKKGCYPGQEIVARTHYLGQAKRQLRIIQGAHLALELPVYRAQEEVGKVFCINSKADTGLAVLQNVTDLEVLVCGENHVKLLPALTGLQRPI